jgi:hypothetical protein
MLNKLSDLFIFILLIETLVLCKTDAIATLITILPYNVMTISIIGNYLFEITVSTVIVGAIFCAAACKCAQFLLFV